MAKCEIFCARRTFCGDRACRTHKRVVKCNRVLGDAQHSSVIVRVGRTKVRRNANRELSQSQSFAEIVCVTNVRWNGLFGGSPHESIAEGQKLRSDCNFGTSDAAFSHEMKAERWKLVYKCDFRKPNGNIEKIIKITMLKGKVQV